MAYARVPSPIRTVSTRIFGPKTSPVISQALAADDFSLILFPDTQNEAQFYPQVLASETQWVANNRAALNIQAVLGLGDIVNDGASTAQQQNADAAIRTLDSAGIPYLLAIGNHDYDNANPSTRTATGFNNWFGPSRYANYAYYQGSYPDGSNENFYEILTINGKQYLFLALEYVPRDAALNWAASIIQANLDKEVIVVTHSFTFVDGTRVDRCDTQDMNRDNYGDKTWSKLISQYPNIIMVVSGHLTDGNGARRADLGVNGNLVNQMFSNYQTLANGGNGWLRILTFHPSLNTIDVSTYSPYLNANKTDAVNQFTLYYHDPHLSAGGQGTISGLVRDSSKCTRIAGATVTAGGASAVTDNNGHYSLTLPASQSYSVTTSADDWNTSTQSATVNEGYASDLNFFLAAKPACTLSTTNRTVTICEPASNATVSSPVHVVAGATDSAKVTRLQVFVDGVGGYSVASASLNTNVAMSVGTHRLTVQATDAAGLFRHTIYITVSSGPALSPSSITFSGSTSVGTTSAPQTATLTAGNSTLTITNIATAGDFKQTNNCGTSLAAGSSCQINVSFAPTASGTRSGSLSVSDSAASSPQVINLTGTGVTTSKVLLSPTSLTFATQNVQTTSAAKTISLTNNNTFALAIGGITTSGDFAQTNNCGSSVAVGGSCTINVTFKPTASGTRIGTLKVSDNDASSSQSASLSGTGASQTCQASTVNRTVTICSPANNASVTSPVHVVAKTTDSSTVTLLQIYVDGTVAYTVKTGSLDTNITLAAGSHRLTVQAKDAAGYFKTTVTITVH
jgi:Carboxypeptidase regulatory-like domain/Bacterial Ig domain/Calcineurin-like phosphoesterase